MGVTGLWQILHPCARPIKLETLNRKRLAVDASIWIYQFLKAVRDKEGNALRNSHVVGFFRRICKLLFFGIKPVFVFDGGAPVLKRQTVSDRKRRREGRRDDAVRTAGKLLAVQMQRRAEEEEQRRKEEQQRGQQEEEVPDESLVYVDELGMTQEERQQTRKFRKKDAYHLPELDMSMNEMGGPNDPRIMSLEELQAYAKQFQTGEDINVYDFSKIDYDSDFFVSLPASDRYNILNAARLRSRLRMGHSKEQLDNMFPDRMAFSKFQIERVTERNELTQRLMHINEGGDTLFNGGGRVAGEKGREYVLVKNDGVEGGWALGVISDEGTKQETAIDLDKPAPEVKQEDEEWEDGDDFEDVPIEGLNRLPKRPRLDSSAGDALTKQRQAFYKSRRSGGRRKAKRTTDPNSLFVAQEPAEDEEEWEEIDANAELFGEANGDAEEDDEELRRAIAMSLGNDDSQSQPNQEQQEDEASGAEDDDMSEVFNQAAVPEARPVPKGSGRAIANIVNKRAFEVAPESHETTSFGVPVPKFDETPRVNDQEEDSIDFQAALAESRRTKRKIASPMRRNSPARKPAVPATNVAKEAGFSGPLPFEKLDLGSSLLGKKKMQERSEGAAGGFENPELAQKNNAEPLPPWFSGTLEDDIQKQKALETEDRERAKEFNKQFRFQSRDEPGLRRRDTGEVIDLDAEDDAGGSRNGEVIDLEAEDDAGGSPTGEIVDLGAESGDKRADESHTVVFDPKIRMGDVADKLRIEPPSVEQANNRQPSQSRSGKPLPLQLDESDEEDPAEQQAEKSAVRSEIEYKPSIPEADDGHVKGEQATVARADHEERAERMDTDFVHENQSRGTGNGDEDEEMLDWSESDGEQAMPKRSEAASKRISPAAGTLQQELPKSPSAEFEDVDIPDKPASPRLSEEKQAVLSGNDDGPAPASGLVHQESIPDNNEMAEFDDFSDPEDEELLRALTLEAEEHARFASTLNNKTQAQNVADYEKELKQLRNQQKKDRRDADEVTQVMIQECQQLLKLFGLPYVTAPMEAEAQCAELVKLGLVDGIVTDDSDCFLFGGTRIYKNMFNQAKFVECYLTSDLEKEFDLTREKLIQVAQLLGSDYTEGLPGVGPVTALEILSEFRTLDDFKAWWNGVQMNTISKSEDSGKPFRKKFRRNATKLFLPPAFPNTRVEYAYTNPDVDSDPEQFQWGVPDLDALRSFLMATIGWSQERADEILVPVIKDMNRRADEGTQANITAFFEGGVGIGAAGASKSSARGDAFAPRRKAAEGSKRMGTALSRMAEKAKLSRGESVSESVTTTNDDAANGTKQKTGRRLKTAARKEAKSPNHSEEDDDHDSDFQASKRNPKKRGVLRKAAKGRNARPVAD